MAFGAYSTRLINKNMIDGNRYITVGDPYKDPVGNPFRAGKKGEKLKAFMTKIYPTPQVEAGYFTKTQYKGGGYQEATRYLETQPIANRKLGFMTKDAHKRDEFSNGVRTEQYRESIRKEKDIIDKGASRIQDQLNELLEKRASESVNMNATKTTDANGFSYDQKVPQYDIGRTRVTPFDPKSKTDTFYKFSHDREKRLGTYKPISTDTGDGAWSFQYKPPQHGGKSEVKNFFDKSHLSI